jgi:DNA sulfur modification protein DndE
LVKVMGPIEHIRLSQQAKDQLTKLKRVTGIEHWNVLCRWAFCASLAEPTRPAPGRVPSDSSVEMSWRVFAGSHQEIYLALLKQRCLNDGLELTPDELAVQFRLHLHRGIAYLAADRDLRNVSDLIARLANNPQSQ